MKRINLVNQPTADTCTSACVAMLTGKPVSEIIEEFHRDFRSHSINPMEYLQQQGVECTPRHSINQLVEWDKIYLLTVPSLNLPGALHHIVLDMREHEGSDVQVLDPNQGKAGKKYYIDWAAHPANENEFQLKSWIVDLEVCI